MKKSFFLILFVTINITFAFSQENIERIKEHYKPDLQLTDSLSKAKTDEQIPHLWIPDYDNPDREIPALFQDNLSLVTTRKNTFFKSQYTKFVIPTTLIAYGIVTQGNQSLRNLDRSTNHEVNKHFNRSIPFDDYVQFAPAVGVYGLDLMGFKAKHSFRERTIVMATSYLIMGATVRTVKTQTKIERPDGSSETSLPSGHTATAFVGAQILFREYKDVSPWIGIGGYVVASATGTFRVLNKKHWVSDVVSGAGVGILSVEVGYMLLPVFSRMLGNNGGNKHSLAIVPIVENKGGGMGVSYVF